MIPAREAPPREPGKGPRVTFCLGMKCEEGLLAIADTRITSGTETSIARKIAVHQGDEHCLFILTSGLRSIRDKALTYFEERLDHDESSLTPNPPIEA